MKKNDTTLTEKAYKDISATSSLKSAFEKQNLTQILNYVEDLEKNLCINKGIISDLANNLQDKGAKKVICSLNNENAMLQKKLKETIMERDLLQKKLLLTQQTMMERKANEDDTVKEGKEKPEELVEKLDKKEYLLQKSESNLYKAIQALKKYARIDNEVNKLLEESDLQKVAVAKISNVVEENIALRNKLVSANTKVSRLESWLTEILKTKAAEKFIRNRESQPLRRLDETRGEEKFISENNSVHERTSLDGTFRSRENNCPAKQKCTSEGNN